MTLLRYGLAFLLSIALLGVARRTSTRHSADYSIKIGNVTASHRTITEAFGEESELNVMVSPPAGLSAVAYYSTAKDGPYSADTLRATGGGFAGTLPLLNKGEKWFYHIDMLENGSSVGRFPPEGDQFIKFKGHVPSILLIPHIFCMFATIYLGLMTVFTAFDVVRGEGDIRRSVTYLFWTTVVVFIGGFPLGFLVAYIAFGQGWSGIPIGWDITDNKTVILFLFWLITLILARKGLRGGKIAVSNGTYLTLAIASLIVSIIFYMIPHSI